MRDSATYKDRDSEFWGRVSPAFQLVAMSVTILLGVGYVILLYHLSTFDIAPTDLIRWQYVAAALWLVGPIMLCVVLTGGIVEALSKYLVFPVISILVKPFGKRWLESAIFPVIRYPFLFFSLVTLEVTILSFFVCAFLFQLPYFLTLGRAGIDPLFSWYSFFFHLCLAIIVLYSKGIVGRIEQLFMTLIGIKPSRVRKRHTSDSVVYLLLAGLSILFVLSFSNDIYPNVPASLGGGQLRTIQLHLVHPSEYSDLFTSQTPGSIRTELVHSDSEFLYIQTANGASTCVQIPLDAVKAIEYMGDEAKTGPLLWLREVQF